MKIIISTLLIVLFLSACSIKNSDKVTETNDLIKTVVLNKQANKINYKSLLLGVWWNAEEENAPTASFEINDSTIYYPDQEGKSEYKYHIKQDSLIFDLDGYISTSKIEKVTKDTLVLITDGDKQIFIKSK